MSTVLKKNFAEFFAGIGLMRIGLERAGWRISFANDIEEDKWKMYRDNFGDNGDIIVGNMSKYRLTHNPAQNIRPVSL